MSTPVRPRVGKETLRQVCVNLGIPEPVFRDDYYELVDMEWFDKVVVDAVFDRINEFIPDGYEKGASDCDKFGLVALVEVQRCYRIKPRRIPGCAIAFGCTDIRLKKARTDSNDEDLNHDLNLLFSWGDSPNNDIGNIVVGFFEPQRCELVSVPKEAYTEATIYV